MSHKFLSCHVSISHTTCAPNYKHISPSIIIVSFSFCVLDLIHFLCLPACNAGALVSNTQTHMKHNINQALAYIQNSVFTYTGMFTLNFPHQNREDFLKQSHVIQYNLKHSFIQSPCLK